MVALLAALLTTGGHTMNLREMGVSQGWVAAEVYSLQSFYLASLALAMLACPFLGRHWSGRTLTRIGLELAIGGALLNIMARWVMISVFLGGRVAAGAGAGLVIYFAPRMLGPRWKGAVAWAVILCPVIGPGLIALATMTYETSDWQHAFFFEAISAAVGLVALLSMAKLPNPPRPPKPAGAPTYLPFLVLASGALLYVLHWGQLHGWLEAPDIRAASVLTILSMVPALWLLWPRIDWRMLGRNSDRLILYFFGGMCQFFYGYLMNVYGGLIVNLSSWQRALLIWPMPIGMASVLGVSALASPYLEWRRGRAVLALPLAIVGILALAAGLYACYIDSLEWPYWEVRDVVDLNWFPAPDQWELAPGRFLMGVGIGLFMVVMDTQFRPDPEREEAVRPLMNVVQFYGGGLAAAILINFLIIGHKVHYSYAAERDTIQAREFSLREDMLTDRLQQVGHPAPKRSAEVMMYKFIHYEADNLVFATIYIAFCACSLVLAGFFLGLWIFHRLRRPPPVPPTAPTPSAGGWGQTRERDSEVGQGAQRNGSSQIPRWWKPNHVGTFSQPVRDHKTTSPDESVPPPRNPS